MAFRKFIGKSCEVAGYVIQTVCIAHCTFNHVGDFVVVSTSVGCKSIIFIVYITGTITFDDFDQYSTICKSTFLYHYLPATAILLKMHRNA